MNITELARRVKIPTQQLREIIPQLGFDVGKKAIQVNEQTAQKIIQQLNNSNLRDRFLKKELADQEIQKTPNTLPHPVTPPQSKILLGETIVVKELARQMNLPVTKLILELMRNGVMASLNQSIDYETAAIIAEDLGFSTEKIQGEKINLETEAQRREKFLADSKENLQPRPPVITIMGHVDHGKTKLLDAIRQTNVMESEAGGITQHVGAYQVKKNNQLLTFIDTPGHEAFSAMRSRGAQVADIIILVIAADDGIQPQTIESISHIRSANLPFIVAINKIDKPEANLDKIKSALAELNLTPEDWGGQTICVEISAKQGLNIDGLLDTLLLVYEMEKDHIQGNPHRPAIGTIIESHLDKSEGSVATVLIQTGTLHNNNFVKIGNCFGRIKNMKNWRGDLVTQAGPSMPVKIVGLKSVPEVGEILEAVEDTKTFRREIKKKKTFQRLSNLANKNNQPATNEQADDSAINIKKLNLIIKTDVLGSQEALIELLSGLQQPDLILNIVQCGLGNITEVDIERALKHEALIIGFNVKPTAQAELAARDKKVTIKTSKIIYELLDYLKIEMNKLLEAYIKQEIIGQFKILKVFRTEKNTQIIGGKVISGKIIKNSKLNIYRQNTLLGQASLEQLQSGKLDVTEVLIDQEAGLKISGFSTAQAGDIIEVIKEERVERKI